MPISGVVITLPEDETLQEKAVKTISSDTRFTVGERFGLKQPVVCETTSIAEDELAFDWLHSVVGVKSVDLVSVDFSDVEQFGNAAPVLGMRGRVNSPSRSREKMTQEVSQ